MMECLGTLVILSILTGCGKAEPTHLPLGFEPVAHNDDWTPYIEEFDGVKMALVPVGCFDMGSTDEQVSGAVRLCELVRGEGNCIRAHFQDEQPLTTYCFTEPFWIDIYEVTNVQYGSSGKWAGDDLPREQVTWTEAVAHCQSRGGRLPTEAEWEYAARGPDGLVFPWGDKFKRDLANSCDKSCLFNMIGTHVDDGYPDIAPVGSFPGGASWVGAMDMAGNVWEWTNSIYMDYPYNTADGREADGSIDNTSRRVLHGGAWFHTSPVYLRGAARYEVWPDYSDSVLGFRCVISFSGALNLP
ncbi:MAG: formylglycine-generating enzyme family protein [Anaerolineales bacterium]